MSTVNNTRYARVSHSRQWSITITTSLLVISSIGLSLITSWAAPGFLLCGGSVAPPMDYIVYTAVTTHYTATISESPLKKTEQHLISIIVNFC